MQQTASIHAYYFFKKKRIGTTNAQKKSWKERESARKCSNYSSNNTPVVDIPISFDAGLLSQLIGSAWFLIFELSPSRATYNSSRLTRGLSVVTGRVGRIVSICLHSQKRKTPPPDAEKKRQQSSSAMRQALVCLYFSSFLKKRTGGRQLYRPFLCLAQRQRVASTNGFCSCFSFLFRAEFYAINSWNALLDKRKRQSGSLPCSPLETSYIKRKRPLPEHDALLLHALSLSTFSSHKA